jgi:hypothetical protein
MRIKAGNKVRQFLRINSSFTQVSFIAPMETQEGWLLRDSSPNIYQYGHVGLKGHVFRLCPLRIQGPYEGGNRHYKRKDSYPSFGPHP